MWFEIFISTLGCIHFTASCVASIRTEPNRSDGDGDDGTTMDDARLRVDDGFDDVFDDHRRGGIVDGDAGGSGKVCEEMDG